MRIATWVGYPNSVTYGSLLAAGCCRCQGAGGGKVTCLRFLFGNLLSLMNSPKLNFNVSLFAPRIGNSFIALPSGIVPHKQPAPLVGIRAVQYNSI